MELKNFSYYKTGGSCKNLLLPTSPEELQNALGQTRDPVLVLGLGSNSLVMDEEWGGSAVLFRHLKNISFVTNDTLLVEAGVENSDFAAFALQNKLEGAGWMNGLPGELGGTVRMNARCYGGEISQIVSKVYAVTRTGIPKMYDATTQKIFRGYKDTIFMQNDEIIVAVEIKLKKVDDTTAIDDLMHKCKNDRTAKGQYMYPSCGCVFKNDYSVGVPSGMLLEAAGAKSLTSTHAHVSQYHANFVYNLGVATSREILELTFVMREAVFFEFGVWLEYEMEVLGEMPKDLSERFREKKFSKANQKVEALRNTFSKKSLLN